MKRFGGDSAAQRPESPDPLRRPSLPPSRCWPPSPPPLSPWPLRPLAALGTAALLPRALRATPPLPSHGQHDRQSVQWQTLTHLHLLHCLRRSRFALCRRRTEKNSTIISRRPALCLCLRKRTVCLLCAHSVSWAGSVIIVKPYGAGEGFCVHTPLCTTSRETRCG
eukprot:2626143-Prymnesium_polylepis.1